MFAIETNNLCKYYGKKFGIEDVNLRVDEGDIFGFIGPNGAGKSTTIRTLLNLLHPTSGTAKIFGYHTLAFHTTVMQMIGYLPGDVAYYEDMSARDLLEYSAGLYKVKAAKRIDDLCERFQLDPDKDFGDLSMGNKKKVAIIQSVLHKPKLLILDEPTNGLDPLMQNEFFDLLAEEHLEGVTIFFSSHVLSDVQRLSHKIAVIKEGKIIAV